ncbi:GA-like domain-containing protein, partial [Enterococcus faecalis]
EGDIKAGLMGQANGLEIPESVTETNADAAKEALSKAEAAVEAAKEAKANADKDKDGYISAEEKAAVDQAIQAAEAAKQAALEEIGKLPEGDIKAGLMGQANGLEIPESVTETNADAAKEALSKAEAAVEAAKEAKANADKDKDGYISAEEKAAVDQAIQAAEAAKQAALEEIGKLPEGDIKAGLMGQANGLEIPESVTETNADAAKEALSKAEAAVEAAKEAKANADK